MVAVAVAVVLRVLTAATAATVVVVVVVVLAVLVAALAAIAARTAKMPALVVMEATVVNSLAAGGGGGRGSFSYSSGNGGSGIVIMRYVVMPCVTATQSLCQPCGNGQQYGRKLDKCLYRPTDALDCAYRR